MAGLSADPRLDFDLRGNRLDGAGLYCGRRGRLGPVNASRLGPLLRAWKASSPYRRMGVIPIMPGGLFDDGDEHTVDAILGDRMVEFAVDDDLVIPGHPRSWVPEFIPRKEAAMKEGDPELFRALAREHDVPFSGLLDGEWTALLYRTPTFAFGATPPHVILLAGLGMRPKQLKGLPLPAGMTVWRSPKWSIVCAELARLEAPALSAEINLSEVIAGAARAQAALDEVTAAAPWRAMIEREALIPEDLEIQLYVRLD